MTYTPPEGVTIGTFTAHTLPASFSAPAGAVVAYKIYGTSAGAGDATGNLWDGNITGAWIGSDGAFNYDPNSSTIIIECDPESEYAIKKFSETNRFRVISYASSPSQAMKGTVLYSDDSANEAVVSTPANAKYLAIYIKSTYSTNEKFTIISGSTQPEAYIPYGYKLPMTVESGAQSQDISIYIGSTKLGAEEYVDYAEQKIYKMSEGTLVPTDPPIPLPAITASGETTITSTETLGDVELTGDWLAIMGSTEGESIDIGFTVDAEEYIALVSVDDGPSIQVSGTITMPSSASSFTLQVVSWGREQYTDTVYNALS